MIESRTLNTIRVLSLIVLAALLSSLSTSGLASTSSIAAGMRGAKEALPFRTSIVALSFAAIMFVAAVRCWFFVRLAKQEAPELGSSRSNHSDLAPITPL